MHTSLYQEASQHFLFLFFILNLYTINFTFHSVQFCEFRQLCSRVSTTKIKVQNSFTSPLNRLMLPFFFLVNLSLYCQSTPSNQ